MTNSVAINASTPSAVTAPAAVAHAATQQAAAATPAPTQKTLDLSSISPRITVDPVAGVITQYLSSNGKVTAQYPSTAVVAYLKAGLTSEGYSKHTPVAPSATSTANSTGTVA